MSNTNIIKYFVDSLTPFIICPEDINVQLKPHQQIARNVWIPRPKSNVDWWK